jgi:hypothetical protein
MAAQRKIPSNQTRGMRLVTIVPITQDNQQVTVDLPRGPHIESVALRVSGTINNSVAFTTSRNQAPYYIFRRIDWVLNSNVTLDSVSGLQALQLMALHRRNLPQSNVAAVGTGNQTMEAVVILDRAIMDMVKPKDSYLKTDVGVSNNQLRIQMGAIANMYTGAGTGTYVSVNLEVWVADYQEARDQNGDTPYPSWYAKRNGIFSPTLAAGNGQQIKINTGNRLRTLSFRAIDGVTLEPNNSTGIGATGPAAYVSRLRVQRAGDTRIDMTQNAGLRFMQTCVGASNAAIGFSLLGQAWVDFANIGQLSGCRYSEFWPIPSSADTYMLVDVVASTVLEIATLEGVDLA